MRGFEEFKLITANEGNPRGLEAVELYRVDEDPRELENLAESFSYDFQKLLSSSLGPVLFPSVGRLRRPSPTEISVSCQVGNQMASGASVLVPSLQCRLGLRLA